MTSAEPAAQRSSAIHGGVAVRSPDGARVCAVRIAQLANFIGPASGGVRTAVAAMGQDMERIVEEGSASESE